MNDRLCFPTIGQPIKKITDIKTEIIPHTQTHIPSHPQLMLLFTSQ